MKAYQRIAVSKISGSKGEVTLLRFLDRKFFDTPIIRELGEELSALVEQDHRKNLLLNLANVESLASSGFNILMMLDMKVKAAGGKLRLCNLKPVIAEIVAITRLDRVLEIKSSENEALADF